MHVKKIDRVTGEKTRKKQAWLSSTHCPEIHIISITKCPSKFSLFNIGAGVCVGFFFCSDDSSRPPPV